MSVAELIPYGRENAVTGEILSLRLGISERKVRRAIQTARSEGNIIINAQDGRGYYRSDDIDDMERQYRQNKNRAMSILVQQKYLRRKLKEAGREV